MRVILEIWPVPPGHRSQFHQERPSCARRSISRTSSTQDCWKPECRSYLAKKYSHRVATLLPDGQIDLDGKTFEKAAHAAAAITGKATNGMWFFLVDPASRRSLTTVRRQYAESLSVDVEDENGDEDVQVYD